MITSSDYIPGIKRKFEIWSWNEGIADLIWFYPRTKAELIEKTLKMCGISNRLQELCNVYVEKTLRPAACLITRRHLYVSDDEEDEEDVEDASDHYHDYDEKLHPDLIFNICGLDQARKCAHYPQVRVHFQALHLMLSTLEALHLFCLFHIRTHPPPPPPAPTPPPLWKLKTLLTLPALGSPFSTTQCSKY